MTTISRIQLLEEQKLRKVVQSLLAEVYEENKKESWINHQIKSVFGRVLKEAKKTDVSTDVPYQNTGINVLRDLLKKIIPIVEIDYKALTSSSRQRQSFRAHILNACLSSLAPGDAMRNSEDESDSDTGELEEEIDVTVGEKEDNPKGFLDIEDPEPENEEEVKNKKFTIPGQELTGRNFAYTTYNKVEPNILSAYESLADPEDRRLFKDGLILNLKLYFRKFEQELESSLAEPATPAALDGMRMQEENSLSSIPSL